MITWKEQRPDFRRKPIEDLMPFLPFTTACTVMLDHEPSPRIVAPRCILDAVWRHLSEQRIEMGGLLIGQVHDLDETNFAVFIEDFARGDEFDGSSVSLRLDTAVWEVARGKLAGEQSVIGWYHSHPNLGAFFSGTDRRTQGAFFNQSHCVGLVVDPIRREEKWFLGGGSEELAPSRVLRFD
jgi:proteasome lid subunit RPN8/RPN11